jgi:hypothetical protein
MSLVFYQFNLFWTTRLQTVQNVNLIKYATLEVGEGRKCFQLNWLEYFEEKTSLIQSHIVSVHQNEIMANLL